jgi:hypothetical protein
MERLGQRPMDWEARLREAGSLVVVLLTEQRRGWSLMIFCARATRGFRKPSRVAVHCRGRAGLHFFEGFSTVAACWNVYARS